MPRNVMSELGAISETGPVLDRINMDLRRRQLATGQARPQGLVMVPKQQQQPKPRDRWATVAARLWAKAIPAKVEIAPGVFSYANPGPGIVALGDLPADIVGKMGGEARLGWDPEGKIYPDRKLDKEETFLLNHLVAMRKKQADVAEQNYGKDPQMVAKLQEPTDE